MTLYMYTIFNSVIQLTPDKTNVYAYAIARDQKRLKYARKTPR